MSRVLRVGLGDVGPGVREVIVEINPIRWRWSATKMPTATMTTANAAPATMPERGHVVHPASHTASVARGTARERHIRIGWGGAQQMRMSRRQNLGVTYP